MDTHGSTWTEHIHVISLRKPSLPFDSPHPLPLQQQRALSSQGAHSDTVDIISFPTDTSKARFTWPTVPSSSCQQEHCPHAAAAGTVPLAVRRARSVHSTSWRTAPPAPLSGGGFNTNNAGLKGRNSQRLLVRATNHDNMLRCHLKVWFSLWSLPQPRAGSRAGLRPAAVAQPRRRASARWHLGGIFTHARRIKMSNVQWETALTPESALR